MAAHILWKWHDMIYVFSRIIWLSSVRDALMTRFDQYDIKHNAFHAAESLDNPQLKRASLDRLDWPRAADWRRTASHKDPVAFPKPRTLQAQLSKVTLICL
jgi:hypothetical protein